MVVPSFPALLADPPRQTVGYLSPFARSVLVDQLEQQPVLQISPRPLHKRRIEHFLPSVEALYICAAYQVLSDAFPVLTSMLSNSLSK